VLLTGTIPSDSTLVGFIAQIATELDTVDLTSSRRQADVIGQEVDGTSDNINDVAVLVLDLATQPGAIRHVDSHLQRNVLSAIIECDVSGDDLQVESDVLTGGISRIGQLSRDVVVEACAILDIDSGILNGQALTCVIDLHELILEEALGILPTLAGLGIDDPTALDMLLDDGALGDLSLDDILSSQSQVLLDQDREVHSLDGQQLADAGGLLDHICNAVVQQSLGLLIQSGVTGTISTVSHSIAVILQLRQQGLLVGLVDGLILNNGVDVEHRVDVLLHQVMISLLEDGVESILGGTSGEATDSRSLNEVLRRFGQKTQMIIHCEFAPFLNY